jgi:hypothetical protein
VTRRPAVVGAVLGAALLGPVAAWSQVGAGSAPMSLRQVEADQVEVDEPTTTAHAVGNARLNYDDIVVTADAIDVNYRTRAVSAQGRVVFRQGDRTLSGSELTFDLSRQTGHLRDISAEADGVFYRGESIDVSPGRWVITGSSLTTCDRPHPHYEITGRRLTVRPGKSATFERAGIWFHGRRVFSWPRYRMSLRKERGTQPSLLPRVGVGRRDGVYFVLTPTLSPEDSRLQNRIEARVTAKRGVRGRLESSYRTGWGDVYLLASQAEDRQEIGEPFGPEENVLTDLSVDRVPEIGVRAVSRPLAPGLTLDGRLSAARVREFPTDVHSRRYAADATLRLDRHRLSPVLSVSETVGLRHARYDHGLDQTVVSLGTTFHYQYSPGLRFDVGYVRRTASGETPFEFDRVQIARELRAGTDWTVNPSWRIALDGRFDLDRQRFRDADITLNRTAHCLVYSVTWRQVSREVSVGMTLARFSGQ